MPTLLDLQKLVADGEAAWAAGNALSTKMMSQVPDGTPMTDVIVALGLIAAFVTDGDDNGWQVLQEVVNTLRARADARARVTGVQRCPDCGIRHPQEAEHGQNTN